MMTDEQLKLINEKAGQHLEGWLARLDEETSTEEDLLAELYAAMVAAYLYGYSPHIMAEMANDSANRLLDLVKTQEETT
jgi:hypothetical protein